MKFFVIAMIAIAAVSIPTRAQAAPCIVVSGERPVLSLDDRDDD
jgi:hypothetical protein